MKFSQKIAAVGAMLFAVSFATPGAAQAENPRNNYDIISTGSDQFGHTGPLRRGYYNATANVGYGADKLLNLHGIDNTELFKAVLQDPDGHENEGQKSDTAWEYNSAAGEVVCAPTIIDNLPFQDNKCSADTQDTNLRLIMEYRDRDDFPTQDQTFGVITLFCSDKGEKKCPPWVNKLVAYPSKGKWPYSLG